VIQLEILQFSEAPFRIISRNSLLPAQGCCSSFLSGAMAQSSGKEENRLNPHPSVHRLSLGRKWRLHTGQDCPWNKDDPAWPGSQPKQSSIRPITPSRRERHRNYRAASKAIRSLAPPVGAKCGGVRSDRGLPSMGNQNINARRSSLWMGLQVLLRSLGAG
jgi:hypothetical protein